MIPKIPSMFEKNNENKLYCSLWTWFTYEKNHEWESILNVLGNNYENKYTKKFHNIKEYILNKNNFLTKKIKNNINFIIHKALRNRFLCLKYTHIWKAKICKKNIKYGNENDLLLEPLSNNCIHIKYDNIIFRFSPEDVIQLFKTSIQNCSFQQPIIANIKNPYTKKIFEKSDLYAFYIGVRLSNVKIYWLLKEYALLDFNKNLMGRRHFSYLKHNAIVNDIKDLPSKEFRTECMFIIKKYIIKRFSNLYKRFEYKSYVVNLENISDEILRKEFTNSIILEYELREYAEDYYNIYKHNIENILRKKAFDFWMEYPSIVKTIEYLNTKKRPRHINPRINIHVNTPEYIRLPNIEESNNVNTILNNFVADLDVLEEDNEYDDDTDY